MKLLYVGQKIGYEYLIKVLQYIAIIVVYRTQEKELI